MPCWPAVLLLLPQVRAVAPDAHPTVLRAAARDLEVSSETSPEFVNEDSLAEIVTPGSVAWHSDTGYATGLEVRPRGADLARREGGLLAEALLERATGPPRAQDKERAFCAGFVDLEGTLFKCFLAQDPRSVVFPAGPLEVVAETLPPEECKAVPTEAACDLAAVAPQLEQLRSVDTHDAAAGTAMMRNPILACHTFPWVPRTARFAKLCKFEGAIGHCDDATSQGCDRLADGKHDHPVLGLRTPVIHSGTGKINAYWARNYNRDLVCRNDDKSAPGGDHLWIEITLEADTEEALRGNRGAFGVRKAECGRLLRALDERLARMVRVVHAADESRPFSTRHWAPLRDHVDRFEDATLTQVVIRGHGNQHSLRLSRDFTLDFNTCAAFLARQRGGLLRKLAPTATIILDACQAGSFDARASAGESSANLQTGLITSLDLGLAGEPDYLARPNWTVQASSISYSGNQVYFDGNTFAVRGTDGENAAADAAFTLANAMLLADPKSATSPYSEVALNAAKAIVARAERGEATKAELNVFMQKANEFSAQFRRAGLYALQSEFNMAMLIQKDKMHVARNPARNHRRAPVTVAEHHEAVKARSVAMKVQEGLMSAIESTAGMTEVERELFIRDWISLQYYAAERSEAEAQQADPDFRAPMTHGEAGAIRSMQGLKARAQSRRAARAPGAPDQALQGKV